MSPFRYQDSELRCEDMSWRALAAVAGTPTYVDSKAALLVSVQQDDLLAVTSAGAYGFAIAPNCKTRPRAAEVLVDGSRYTIVRRRETYEDLVAGETAP